MTTLAHWHKTCDLERRVQVLKAVAHPLRLCIIAALAVRARNVGALAAELDVPQAIVSQQLRILRMSRLVATERRGGLAVYRLTEAHLRALLKCIERCSARP